MAVTRSLIATALFLLTVSDLSVTTRIEGTHRLPSEIPIPSQYIIKLTPDLESESFIGEALIDVTATIENDTITLHAKNLSVISAGVLGENDTIEFADISEDVERDFLYLKLSTPLVPEQNYTISINYTGVLHNDMYGFYISTYTDSDGGKKKLAATQFQPTHARKAFPCFDEPKYKAVFQITIVTPEGYHSLSNTLLESEPERKNGIAEDKFLPTPIMSSYLIAFVVSDFIKITDSLNDVVAYATYARGDAIDSGGGNYSIEITPDLVKTLEAYTNISYIASGLSKVDQVALPDFSAGAMENWGLITYRETALLYVPNKSTASAKQRVATVIGHELTHMWFGNLVTLDWWSMTWLNEGFARYFEYYATSKVETKWRLMEQFVVQQQQSVFGSDALAASEPLTNECDTAAEVRAMFGTITYNKGGSVLRMISNSLTETVFQKALQTYLDDRKFDTTTSDILITHLKNAAKDADKDMVSGLVMSFTEQAGYPVITVIRDYQEKTAALSQSRFLLIPDGSTSPNWTVPLTWTVQDQENAFQDTTVQKWMTSENDNLANLPEDGKWIIFNNQETGYYRVNYDVKNWNLLSDYLKGENREKIHVVNRAQLIDDALNLARAGNLSYNIAIRLTEFLKEETDYIPWASALNGFSFLYRRLAGLEDYSHFQNYIHTIIAKVYKQLHFNTQTEHVDQLHQSNILNWACAFNYSDCFSMASTKLQALMKDGTPVEPDQQSVVYCYGLKDSTKETWDFLWAKYSTSTDAAEKTLLLSSLGCSTDTAILESYLQKSIKNDSGIRMQDASSVFSAVYANPQGLDTALNFLINNFDTISTNYGSMGSIGTIVRGIAGQITSDEQATKFKTFLDNNALPIDGDKARQTVDENLKWVTDYRDQIIFYLKSREGAAPGPLAPMGVALFAFAACVVYLR